MEFDSPLSIITWNADGLTNRTDELRYLLSHLQPFAVLLQETNWKAGAPLSFPGYTVVSSPRPTGRGGGTAILVAEGTPFDSLITPVDLECTAIRIHHPLTLTLVSAYVKTNRLDWQPLLHFLRRPDPVILAGDLNARHRLLGSSVDSVNGNRLRKQRPADITLLVPPKPTHRHHCGRYPPSTLSYFLTNTDLRGLITVHDIGTSDHSPVMLTLPHLRFRRRRRTPISIPTVHWASVANDLQDVPWAALFSPSYCHRFPEDAALHLSRILQAATCNNTTYIRLRSPSHHPLAANVKDLLDQKKLASTVYRIDPSAGNLYALRRISRRVRSAIRRNILAAKLKKIAALQEDPGTIWTHYKRATTPPHVTMPPLRTPDGFAVEDADRAVIIATALQHRMSPGANEDQPLACRLAILEAVHEVIPTPPPPVVSTFTPAMLSAAIQALKRGKASGPDGIANETLQRLPPAGVEALTNIFNGLYYFHRFPASWAIANVTPLPKPGKDLSDPLNWRPISLLSCVSKLYERCVLQVFQDEAEALDALPSVQFGFRAGHSTSLQLVRVVNKITTEANNGNYCAVAALDITGAFDTVAHDDLLFQLRHLGFSAQLRANIRAFLSHRCLRVRVGDSYSPPVSISAGVPQGAILSPLLYACYTADVPVQPPPDACPRMLAVYADDTAGIVAAPTADDALQAGADLVDELSEWTSLHRLSVNRQKTQVLIVHPAHPKIAARPRHFNGLSTSPAITYLGVRLDAGLTFWPHVQATLVKARQRFNQVRSIFPQTRAHPDLKLLLYRTTIRPIIMYGLEAAADLSVSARTALATFERKVLRWALWLPRRTRISDLYDAANILPIHLEVHHRLRHLLHSAIAHPNPEVAALAAPPEPGQLHRTPAAALTDSSSMTDSNDSSA